MNAWLFQDPRQKNKLGADCPWSVGWIDPDGKRKSKKVGSKSAAEKYRKKTEGELAAGLYRTENRKLWDQFRDEYESKILNGMGAGTRQATLEAVGHFERIIKPARMSAIKTQTIDEFIATRRLERGRKKKSVISPATVNKDLRHLKAVLRVALEWGYLAAAPRIRMLKEPGKLPRYVTAEHFAAIYQACDHATKPQASSYAPADWWRALLVFAYMTGWRVGEPLALRRDDLDLEAGTAITRADDNKGKRDDIADLHPVVVDHLRRIQGFDLMAFPWPHHRRTLSIEFHAIQKAAGIHLPCNEKHEHTDACHAYGFHDLRRAFATVNAATLTGPVLQKLMRHKSFLTTQRYVNMASQVSRAVNALHVPDCLQAATG